LIEKSSSPLFISAPEIFISKVLTTHFFFLQFPLPQRRFDVDHQIGVDLLLVLQPMSATFHVHLFSIRVIEAALAQLTVETDDFSF
jgi:hypothetical protein